MTQRTRVIPYNQAVRQNNFFSRATESPLALAGGLIAQSDTKDTESRRGSGFSVKRPKLGDPDFDFSALNLNLR